MIPKYSVRPVGDRTCIYVGEYWVMDLEPDRAATVLLFVRHLRALGGGAALDWYLCGVCLGAAMAAAAPVPEIPQYPDAADVAREILDAPLPPPVVRACRVCGCTFATACHDDSGRPCHWVEADLCSLCAPGAGRRLSDSASPAAAADDLASGVPGDGP